MSYTPQFEKEYEDGWVDFPSEETLITAHALNMYDDTLENVEDYLSNNPIIQKTVMPIASEDELGNIYQYMGATDANYTQGYFYKCMDDGEEPPLYFWARINVQPGGGGGGGALEDLDDVNITSPTDGEGLIYNGSNQKWKNGNAPSALTNDYWNNSTTYAVGDIVIYLNGLYRCIVANTGQTPTDTAYWESIALKDISKHYYSTVEKVVGEWINGKPIYERAYDLGAETQMPVSSWYDINYAIPNPGFEIMISAIGIHGNGTLQGMLMAGFSADTPPHLLLQGTRNTGATSVQYIVLQYTKTTD